MRTPLPAPGISPGRILISREEIQPMKYRIKSLGALALGFLGLAGYCWAETPVTLDVDKVKPSSERTLQLPETPYRYADINWPAHFNTPAARRFDNTPAGNRLTDA